MSERIESFRQLHDALDRYDGADPHADVLMPSLADVQALMAPLQSLRRLATSPPGAVDQNALWDLFALSVIDDALLSRPRFRPAEHATFFSLLGFEPFDEHAAFSPLTCEIVAVSNDVDGPESGIELLETHWPGLRFGELVFARCAKSVRCRPSLGIVEGIADKSMLHFTNERRGRPCNDFSHGWGHNSRWRTDFHRNYAVHGVAFYNVDGPLDIGTRNPSLERSGHPPAELPLDQAREILMHRGFVRTPRFADEWPYHWRMAVRDSGRSWPLDEADLLPFDAALREVGVA